MEIIWRLELEGECSSFDVIPQGATIEAIDGVLCIGYCGNCGHPILEYDGFATLPDGSLICEKCDD